MKGLFSREEYSHYTMKRGVQKRVPKLFPGGRENKRKAQPEKQQPRLAGPAKIVFIFFANNPEEIIGSRKEKANGKLPP
ncbi:hypothetical protein ACUUL3_14595 [Thiovibrio sp. JS02]